MKYVSLEKYKEAATLLIQLLDVPLLIPTKYREYIILDIADLLPNVSMALKIDNFFLIFVFNFFKYKLSEDQIFTILRAIQNDNNRVKIFNETIYKPKANSNTKTDMEVIEIQDEKNAKLLKISQDLSKQLADCFVGNSIELN